MKYSYIMEDSNNNIFSLVSDNVDINGFLKRINGVYSKLVWVIQKNNITKEKKRVFDTSKKWFYN